MATHGIPLTTMIRLMEDVTIGEAGPPALSADGLIDTYHGWLAQASAAELVTDPQLPHARIGRGMVAARGWREAMSGVFGEGSAYLVDYL